MQPDRSRSRRWFLGLGAAWSAAVVACRSEDRGTAPPSRARSARPSARTDRDRSSKRPSRFFNQNTKVPLEEASSRTPLHDTYGIITPSSLHFERHHSRRARDRSGDAHADDSRPGRSAARLHRRRAEAAAVGLAHPLSRVLGQQRRRMARRLDRVRRAAHPRPDQLQRVDRRAGRRRCCANAASMPDATWVLAEGADAASTIAASR